MSEKYDHESASEIAKRAVCDEFGHVTVNELALTQATHGTRHVCLYCGKFWHGEPTPPVVQEKP